MQSRRKHGWTFQKSAESPTISCTRGFIYPTCVLHPHLSITCFLYLGIQPTANKSFGQPPNFPQLWNLGCVWRLHSFRYFLALWPVIKMFSQTPVFLFHTHNNFEMYYCWETPFLLPTSPQREALAEAKEVFTVTSWEKVTHSLDLIKFSKADPRTDTQELQSEYLHCFIFFSKIPCPLFKK